jgi:Fur family zinc uptake transcriptional regulator
MRSTSNRPAFPPPGHNHGTCLASAIARTRAAFEARGMRLTELRQRVFEEIASSHHAVGAYDVLERLATKGRRLAPVSVYRALEALLEARVVHRLESRNAYFACHASHEGDARPLVLACERCLRVAEVAGEPVFHAIESALGAARFEARRTVIEISGECVDCRGRGPVPV